MTGTTTGGLPAFATFFISLSTLRWENFVFEAGRASRQASCQLLPAFQIKRYTFYFPLIPPPRETFKHGAYQTFNISDPKPRNIHKATIRDRILHRALYRQLYPFFDKKFIFHSFSCRDNKGTHKALNFFRSFFYQASQNNTKNCWVLKGDIKKFFASIDHDILIKILAKYIPDQGILWLLDKVIESFSTKPGIGLPLGNLTSQLLVNIYLNEFDQFVKHQLKAKYYIRYADDFVILSPDKFWLEQQILLIKNFLWEKLRLILHPQKVSIRTIASGVDFLGWISFPDHKVIRTSTKRRMIKRIKDNPTPETIASYLGLLGHGNTYKIKREILDKYNLEKLENLVK